MLVKSSCSNVFNKILRLLWETGGAGYFAVSGSFFIFIFIDFMEFVIY